MRVDNGLRPGSEDAGFDHHDPAFVRDPESHFGSIRRDHPILHSDRYGGFWLLTRYEDVTAAALDHEAFTSAVVGTTVIPPSQPREHPLLPIELDPPEHTRYRALVNPLFAKPRIDAMRPSSRRSRRSCSSRSCATAAATSWPSSLTPCRLARWRGS